MMRLAVLRTAMDGTLISPRLLFHGFSRELRRVFFICIDFFRKFHSGCLDVFSSAAVIYTLYIQNIKNSICDNLTKSSTYRSGLRIST